jgi:hypothetical protein
MADIDQLDPNFRDALMQMIAASDGRLYITSGYRSTAEQQALYDEAVATYGADEAANWAAPPGHSNHEKGIAADLGGDLDWAHAHAADFGLYFPMDWESWHVEPVGSRDQSSPQAYTTPPSTTQYKSLNLPQQPARTPAPEVLMQMLGIGSNSAFNTAHLPNTRSALVSALAAKQPNMPTIATTPVPSPANTNLQSASTADIDKFMAAIRAHESGGDYRAYNSLYGASGAYQFLDSTWGNYGGYTSARDAPPSVQDEYARRLMLDYYAQFGNWGDVAGAWFAGPAGDFSTREVQDYINYVLGAMNG